MVHPDRRTIRKGYNNRIEPTRYTRGSSNRWKRKVEDVKEYKIAVVLIVGVAIGYCLGRFSCCNIPKEPSQEKQSVAAVFDEDVHQYISHQLISAPNIHKVISLQMGFDGKSISATILVDTSGHGIISKKEREALYTLSDVGYYESALVSGDYSPPRKLWPYKLVSNKPNAPDQK